jgi:hypothetical protein
MPRSIGWHTAGSLRFVPPRLGAKRYEVCVGPLNLSGHDDEASAAAWIEAVRLESLAVIIARHRKLHPVLVLIEGKGGRLARIPPELWATYDGLVVSSVDRYVSVLSAKARSLYEGDTSVFVRIHKAGHSARGAPTR